MRFSQIAAATLIAALAGCNGAGMNSVPPNSTANTNAERSIQTQTTVHQPTAAELGLWPRPGPAIRVCGAVPQGYARCQAWIRTDIRGLARPNTPSGYGPSDLQTAYGLTSFSSSNGGGETVAIVDAYDDPNAASDLAVYRKQYGLPACSASSGCFTKQKLGTATNTGWGEEESLDVDMASAICPNCKILLVEAKTASLAALVKAEQYATAHADYVSNSWSGNEGSTTDDKFFNVSGVAITAATGDSGYNSTAQWPAILPTVVGVGGTSLTSVNPRTETAWTDAGSGCSKIYATPSFQKGITTGCSKRAQADSSADADPYTGVAVYDTFHQSGWEVFGGTSVATPITASVFALAGNTATNNPGNLYAHTSDLNDITVGSNGTCGKPLCIAGPGWDGPTGLGTPNGIGAF
ncbi:MAG: S53 family peptidase [Candidatus Eremiobacteraeota bacterium]|nr:S53 family peptidase [Candidatus Eremiobacteraeota bacterium]